MPDLRPEGQRSKDGVRNEEKQLYLLFALDSDRSDESVPLVLVIGVVSLDGGDHGEKFRASGTGFVLRVNARLDEVLK